MKIKLTLEQFKLLEKQRQIARELLIKNLTALGVHLPGNALIPMVDDLVLCHFRSQYPLLVRVLDNNTLWKSDKAECENIITIYRYLKQ